MNGFENFHKAEASSASDSGLTSGLPASTAHNYITDMLAELTSLAKTAQLLDLAALLDVTATAAKINGRYL